jgi:hypothetical protein
MSKNVIFVLNPSYAILSTSILLMEVVPCQDVTDAAGVQMKIYTTNSVLMTDW